MDTNDLEKRMDVQPYELSVLEAVIVLARLQQEIWVVIPISNGLNEM